MLVHHRDSLIQRPREHHEPLVQLPAHPQRLRALTGKHQHRLARRPGPPHHRGRIRPPRRQTRQTRCQRATLASHHHRAMLEHRPGADQRPPHVQWTRLRPLGEVGGQPLRLQHQRTFGAGREHPGQCDVGRRGRRHWIRLRRILFHDDVCVGAAHPEGRDAGAARPAAVRPRRQRGVDAQAETVQVDVGVGALEVQARRDRGVFDGQDRLEQARDPGGAGGVADVGLHRSHRHRVVGSFGENPAQRLGFDGVADPGAGAVRLDVVDVGAAQAGLGQRAADHVGLGGRRWQGLGGRAVPGVAHRGGADDGVDAVAVPPGRRQRFEQHQPAALAAHVAVGAPVEGIRVTRHRHRAEFAFQQGDFVGQVEVDAARDGQRRLPAAHALAAQVHRDQRGRLAGVDGHAGAAQPEQVRDPVGDHAPADAGEGVVVHVVGDVTQRQRGVIVGHRTQVHRNRFSA
ncbi:hypothetical protein PICSAR204_04501 [Mycobacterium avium subsp. paratuberculosis]|nr:hypothetical protein PICSAR124_04484 [Mycobacterium avium subsp. paratuberculosis]CAG7028139.1 hypothetical protein PICSAR140_04510 [Mycobacterium avium subsp. paratuberculosis]CAG7119162.1 hypothetical protein PICSAR204_04501 [Mycobacterium avium subsp. paratuberculosis]